MNKEQYLSCRETHPYPSFIPHGALNLIIGSFPPIKLTRKIDQGNPDPLIEIYNRYLLRNPRIVKDVDFYFGSSKNLFWKILGEIYETSLNDPSAIKTLLAEIETGITDIYEICVRKLFDRTNNRSILPEEGWESKDTLRLAVSSGDTSLHPLLYRDIPAVLRANAKIGKLIFTSSFVFREFGKIYGESIRFERERKEILLDKKKVLQFAVLPSPSGAANKSIGSIPEYKRKQDSDPTFNTYKYRLDIYRKHFKG